MSEVLLGVLCFAFAALALILFLKINCLLDDLEFLRARAQGLEGENGFLREQINNNESNAIRKNTLVTFIDKTGQDEKALVMDDFNTEVQKYIVLRRVNENGFPQGLIFVKRIEDITVLS